MDPEDPIIPEQQLDMKSIECKRKLLFDASIMGDIDTVEVLLAQGVDPNYLDPTEGITPLIGAIKNKQYQLMEVLLLNPKTGLDVYDQRGFTGLIHLVTLCPDDQVEKKLNLVNIKFILEVGANVNLTSKEGSTPLFYACLFGLNEIVSLLLDKGAQPNIVNVKGLTPLHNAAAANNLEQVLMLVKHGADINMRDYDEGLRPLDLTRHHDIIPILQGYKTSISHPIVVDFIDSDVCPILKKARIGMSMCPGRNKGVWKRHLGSDLSVFTSAGANVVVTLVTKTEMHDMGIPNLLSEIENKGMTSIQYSIQNKWIPNNSDTFVLVVHQVTALIREGKSIIVHCNGGKGRTGLIITACLVLLGLGQDEAINAIRSRRPGMLYNPAQQIYLLSVTSKMLALNQEAPILEATSQHRIAFEDSSTPSTGSTVNVNNQGNVLVTSDSNPNTTLPSHEGDNAGSFDANQILLTTLDLGSKSFNSLKSQFTSLLSTPLFSYVDPNTTTTTTTTTNVSSNLDGEVKSEGSPLSNTISLSNSNPTIKVIDDDDDDDDDADLTTISENIKKAGDHL